MRLAIADPPYPPIRAAHPRNDKPRASFWYGDSMPTSGQNVDRADSHPNSREWDDPARHRQLLLDLEAEYDGWAIATAHDGLPCYGELPRGCRVMIWHKTNSMPTASRIRNVWEPVIVKPHETRRSAARGGSMADLLVASAPRKGFAGSKPDEWVRWVLNALGYDPDVDTVDDLFPGSGGVELTLSAPHLPLPKTAGAGGRTDGPSGRGIPFPSEQPDNATPAPVCQNGHASHDECDVGACDTATPTAKDEMAVTFDA